MSSRAPEQLERMVGRRIYAASVAEAEGATYFLAREGTRKVLGIVGKADGFEGARVDDAYLCPLNEANAAALRERLPWLRPKALGLALSFGCGDRLGLATPGHVRAVRHARGVAPIFAQQSIRENTRTGRNPAQVVDDAMWGVFQEGWRDPWGADADHLKTLEDVDVCVVAGYTLFTIDPGDHVDGTAHSTPLASLRAALDMLPWGDLDTSVEAMRAAYEGRTFRLDDGHSLTYSEETLLRAAAKYGRAIAHVVRLYRHLHSEATDFELEVSVDETETPTTPEEHFFVASELKRLGVRWVSLAPRYLGRFEKGVDYIGNLHDFEADLSRHAAVARTLGPYKLSLHSGSDKYSVYPFFARHSGQLVHVKTAGTSYLEALRAIAGFDPTLFREIYRLAFDRYEQDRATYHASANPAHAPQPRDLSDRGLSAVLGQFDAREMLHVTFGSALAKYGRRLKEALAEHEEVYYQSLQDHFLRHLRPLVQGGMRDEP